MRKEQAMSPLMKRSEAIEYLCISERMMCDLTAQRKIAYIQHKPGGKMFFRQADLDAYLDSIRVPTMDELGRRVALNGGTYRKRRAV